MKVPMFSSQLVIEGLIFTCNMLADAMHDRLKCQVDNHTSSLSACGAPVIESTVKSFFL